MSGLLSMGRPLGPLFVTALALLGAQAAVAQRSGQNTVPSNTVVRLKMDTALNSRDAKEGDRFAAVLAENDRSGFPEGTRFQGMVREVQRYTKKKPGMLDVEIQRAYLPGGEKLALSGRLASLAGDDVRRMENGRLETRKQSGSKMDWKWAGYGAGAGAVLSTVLGGKILKGAVLGGLGGAAYGYLTRNQGGKGDKDTFRDVDLPRGTEFGMRLQQEVAFANRTTFRYASDQVRTAGARTEERVPAERPAEPVFRDRVRDERSDPRYREATVRLNGRTVTLDEPAMNLNGILYVPLEPIAAAANLRFTHRAGQEGFTLATPDGRVSAAAGDTRVTLPDREALTLAEQPVSINGTIFVSADYLDRAANLSPRWDASNLRLELQTRR